MARYTGLILITGEVTGEISGDNGSESTKIIESGFLDALSPFAIEILDKQIMEIRDRFFLAIYIKLDRAHQKAIEKDLELAAERFKVDLAIDFKEF